MERFKTGGASRRFSSPNRNGRSWHGLAMGACVLLAGACEAPPDAATGELGAAGSAGGPAPAEALAAAQASSPPLAATASTAAGVAAPFAASQVAATARLAATKIDARLLPTGQANAPGEVILLLDEATLPPVAVAVAGEVAASVPGTLFPEARLRAFASRLNAAKAGLLGRMAGERLATVKSFENLPAMHLRLDSARALMALAGDAAVARIVPNEQLPLLADPADLTLINQPKAAAAGKLGAGTTVVVLDTGTDYTRAPFNCTAAGAAGCSIVYAADIAADDKSLDDNGHGTNVSGIVHSVAPSAQIAALDVFTGTGAFTTDIMTAIDWAITNKAKYKIVSINMSLGGGTFTTTCPTDALAVSVAKARAAGILSAVASGNSGSTNAISSPACSPDAVSVGAVHAANLGGLQWSTCADATTQPDQVACFSSSSSFLTVLAPGVQITAAGITMSGTSQATPHVAGAIAVLRSAFPAESLTDTVTRLTAYGVPVKDPRNGITKPRIDLFASLNGAAPSPTPTPTPAPTPGPVGTISLNAAAAFTKSAAVTATLATTSGTATQVCLSEAAACTAFVPSAASLAFTLSAGDGKKTVNAWWKDAAGKVSAAPATASIILDATAPVGGTLTATGTGLQAVFTWSGFTDAGSGIGGYRLVTGTSAAIAAGCQSGTVVYEGAATTFTQTLTASGTLYARVCGKDALGNMSAGSAASLTLTAPAPPPPAGTIALNAKAAFTKTTAISATLAVTTGTATQVCLSEASTCTSWVPSTTSTALAFTLSTGDGKKTVNAWWKNAVGAASPSPASASIVLDTTAPVGGTLAVTATGLQAAFTWSGFSDAGSGIAGYRLVTATTAAAVPAGCQSGTVVYEGTATTFAQTLTAAGTLYARLCAKDALGNMSAGSALGVALAAPPVPTTRSALLVGSDSTTQVGSATGGTAYNDACPAGQVLTGLGGSLSATTTAAVNRQISGHCGVVQISGATVTIKAGATLPTRGAAGLAAFTRDCPANQVVVGFSGRAGLLVDQIALTCAPLSSTASAATGAALSVGATTSTVAAAGGTGGTALTPVRCPTGEVATTTRLRTGDNLDAFGLACAKPTLGAN